MKTKRQDGFTLVEIILSISLIAVLFSLSAWILDRGVASFATISTRSANQQDARYAMERMVRELVLVQTGPSGDLKNIKANQISFVDKQGNNTSFELSGQTLNRGSNPLLNHVTGLTFTAYRSNGQTTQSPPQTRRVEILLTTLPPGETATLTLRTDVFLRTDMYENFK